MSTVIEVDRLAVRYGRTYAVEDVSFEVEGGEVFALLGTNGAGKTTTLDVIEGYRSPTSGSVRVLDLDPSRDHDKLAPQMGVMLQDAGFFETLTVVQTVRAWRRFYTAPRPASEVLESVGLIDRADVRCAALSGGERRRLDLALALLGEPEVLFLDEPTTGMDPEARAHTLDLVRQLVGGGTTVLLTTHYLEEAEQLADRVAIMNAGRVEAAGTLGELHAMAGASRITFSVAAAWADALPLPDEDVRVDRHPQDAKVTVLTEHPQSVVGLLSDWAKREELELHDLSVRPGGLAEVFNRIAAGAVRSRS